MSTYLEKLGREAAALHAQADELRASGRGDEAALTQIRINMHEICRALYQASLKAAGEGGLREAYLAKLEHVSQPWAKAREQATAHGDECRAIIETLKLDTLDQLRRLYLETEG